MEARIGEENIASNGQKMTIIAYRKYKDIDVKFEDGTIVNSRYLLFKKGNIKNPNFKLHLGEVNFSKNGEKMTIINYVSCNNIDVQFEDGTIVKNKQYIAFKKREILNPNYYRNKHIGTSKINSMDQKMTIVDYKGSKNIDVQFEDGTVVKNKTISLFNTGKIINPKTLRLGINLASFRIGETSVSTCGQKMTIIAYRKVNDLDVQFEDGTIVCNKHYKSFKNGNILNPNTLESKAGEVNFSTKGQKMTIIDYRSSNDIDVQFEDGTIIKNRQYNQFKTGQIKNPNFKDDSRVGETNISNVGQKMTIIAYRKFNDIDVQFEDGSIAKHKNYDHFLKGDLANPNFYKNQYLGETNKNTDDFKMTIIAYRKYNDIDVQFEDGSIVKNKQYHQFKIGTIEHPNKMQLIAKERIGEQSKTINGQTMTIIAYRGSYDIDVQFEDGTIIKNKRYDLFKEGQLANPNFYQKRVGEESMSLIGLKMKIIRYESIKDIDVEFEDGTIVKNKGYNAFKLGKIGHPYIKNNSYRIPFLYVNNISGKMILNKYFHCKCSKCGLEAVMTFEEAKNHNC